MQSDTVDAEFAAVFGGQDGRRSSISSTRIRTPGSTSNVRSLRPDRNHSQIEVRPCGFWTAQLFANGRNAVWQKIENDVILFIESVRAQRLANERKALLHDRFSAFTEAIKRYQGDVKRTRDSDFDPQFKDLILMPGFRALLDTPDSADMSPLDDDDKMRAMFDNGRAKWQEDRRSELCGMLQESVDSSLDDTGLLALTQALFRCLKCRRDGLRYPEVLAHECPRKFSWRYLIGWGAGHVEDVDQHAVATYKHHYRPAWSGERSLTASTQAIAYMRSIMEACGLDPDTVTPQEADACGVRLICRKCEGGSDAYGDFSDDHSDSGVKRNTFTIYNWPRAVSARSCIGYPVALTDSRIAPAHLVGPLRRMERELVIPVCPRH